MSIENMIDRVVVIDNREDEIEDLVAKLRGYDISVDKYVVVDDFTSLPVMTKNRQLIFIDLMLDEDESHTATNIARVIQILKRIVGKGFGPYGLVVWTKHTDKMKDVITRLTTASSPLQKTEEQYPDDEDEVSVDVILDNPPLFVIDVDKIQFKRTGEWDFSGLIPILNQRIQESNASYFFLRWLSVTRQASQDTIDCIYRLTGDYQSKEAEISHLLYLLAFNHTGISHDYPGITSDTYKAFSDIMHPKIYALTSSESIPDYSKVDTLFKFKDEDYALARLNEILFIDGIGIEQSEIVPGNIYQIMEENSPLIVKPEERIKLQKKKPNGKDTIGYKDYDCVPIAIELTPPCDFSNKKIASRLIGGYIVNYAANSGSKKLKSESGDKNYILPPVTLPGDEAIKYVIFDFRHLFTPTDESLRNPSKYKVLFRTNPPLFSDILQKFSSHAARLGLNGLVPWD